MTFTKTKKEIKIDDIDVNKILVFKEEPYSTKNSFKYFLGYNDNNVIRPLWKKVPQMIGYVRKFEGNTRMSFKINDSKLLEKLNQIQKKVEKLSKSYCQNYLCFFSSDILWYLFLPYSVFVFIFFR